MLSRDEVIRMAEDNGAVYYGDRSGQMGFGTLDVDVEGLVKAAYAAGQSSEREACAKVCHDALVNAFNNSSANAARQCRDAIRARGEKGGDAC